MATKQTTTANTVAAAAPAFLQSLANFGTVFAKQKGAAAKADPLAVMRTKFANNATINIAAIAAGAAKGKWFEKQGDQYVVGFRNSNTIMSLVEGQSPYLLVKDADSAVAYITAAKVACEAGELDAALTKSQRAPGKSKKGATATAPE